MRISNDPTWFLGRQKRYSKLKGNQAADVVVIGGGITGVLTAYLLAKSGKNVVLLEGNMLGSGATGYTTAFITHVIDTRLADLIKMFGKRKAKLIWQSGRDAITMIEAIVKKEKIDCEFMRCSASIYPSNAKEYHMLEEEHRIARQFGFSATMNKGKQLPFAPSGWFAVNNQAKFHPLKFLRGVTSAIESSGGKLFEHSKVLSLEPTAGGGVAIKTAGGNITAKDVVIATYVPFNNPKTVAYKKAMYATYVLEVQIPPKTFSEGLFWDCDSPYHYFRIDRGRKFDRMIVGGEDHRADVPINKNKSFAALEEYLAGLLLGKRYTIVRRWVGGVLESVDGIPFIGAYEPHQFVATAFSGNGMTYAMIAASIFRDLIVKKRASKDIWMHVFDPKRSFTLYRLVKKGMDYGEEFFGGAVKNTLRER